MSKASARIARARHRATIAQLEAELVVRRAVRNALIDSDLFVDDSQRDARAVHVMVDDHEFVVQVRFGDGS